MRKIVSIFALAMALSGCALTPEYQRPDTTELLGDNYIHSATPDKRKRSDTDEFADYSSFSPMAWWTRFQDPVLDKLVETALQHNYDLRVAAANVLESEALLRAAFGNRLPTIDASASGERSFFGTDGNSSFSASSSNQRIYTTTYRVGASISWETDLFGRLRSQQNATLADLKASRADREALIHTIIANVTRQRVALAIAQQRLKVGRSILESRQNTLDIVDRRYRHGVTGSSAVDVRLARENVYSAQANIATLEQNIILAQTALDVLLGQKPAALLTHATKLNELPVLDTQITGIPAQLLDRRPDLQAAEFRVIAANERVGVALADLYPNLTITANSGWSDDILSDLFTSDSLFGSVVGQLTQAIFHGGTLQAETEAARARLQAQSDTYANEVLQAIREVEDALIQNQKLVERLHHVEHQVREARIAEQLSRKRYARGVEELLIVLETERRRQDAEDSLLQAQENYWKARIDLHLAIGGDWLTPETRQQVIAQETP